MHHEIISYLAAMWNVWSRQSTRSNEQRSCTRTCPGDSDVQDRLRPAASSAGLSSSFPSGSLPLRRDAVIYTYIHIYIYIYICMCTLCMCIYIYICMYVSMCVDLQPQLFLLFSSSSGSQCTAQRSWRASMPGRNARRKRAMEKEQYTDYKRKKHERHLGNQAQKAQEELAKVQEERKAELAALEASYIPQGPYKMKLYEIHARSLECFKIRLCVKLLESCFEDWWGPYIFIYSRRPYYIQ